MIHELEPFLDRGAHALGELARMRRIGSRQQHHDGIFGVTRDPVVLPEVLPDQDPEPLENPIADSVAVPLVDRRQMIDVEENQRHRLPAAARPLELLGEHGVEHRPRVDRRQLVHDGCLGRLQLHALRVRGEDVERRAPHQLGDEGPRLAGGADRFAQRQLVERAALQQIDKREEATGRQVALERHAMQIGDDAAARIDLAVAYRHFQQLNDDLAHAIAVLGLEQLRAAERKDRHRVPHEHRAAIMNRRRDSLTKIFLDGTVSLIRIAVRSIHGRVLHVTTAPTLSNRHYTGITIIGRRLSVL